LFLVVHNKHSHSDDVEYSILEVREYANIRPRKIFRRAEICKKVLRETISVAMVNVTFECDH